MNSMLVLLLAACAPDKPTADTAPTADPDTAATDTTPVDSGSDTQETAEPSPDADRDGHDAPEHGGDDCDDADASVHPGADEVPYDGLDQDCDGTDVVDVDGDGFVAVEAGGDDCDDQAATAFPGGVEAPETDVDEDCDGYVDLDVASLGQADAVVTGSWEPHRVWMGGLGAALGPDYDADGVGDLVLGGAGMALVGSSQLGGALAPPDLLAAPQTELLTMFGLEFDASGATGRTYDVMYGAAPRECGGAQEALVVYDLARLVESEGIDCDAAGTIVRLTGTGGYGDAPDWRHDFDGDGLADLPFTDGRLARAWVIAGADLPASGVVAIEDVSVGLSMPESFFTQADGFPDLDGDGYDTLGIVVAHYDYDVYLLDGDELVEGADPRTLARTVLEDTYGSEIEVMEPGDVDGDGGEDVLLLLNYGGDPTGEDCFGSLELFLGLDAPGTRTAAGSDGRVCAPLALGEPLLSAALGSLRADALDVVFSYGDGARFLPFEDFPRGATRYASEYTEGVDGQGVRFAADRLLLADLDGDGDDDLVGTNGGLNADYSEPATNWGAPGIATVFFNPRADSTSPP